MNHKARPQCYGAMFPDLSQLNMNRVTEGRAFRVFVQKLGCSVQQRKLDLKQKEWDKCEECGSFDGCYRLSEAKLLLWQGLLAAV